MKKRVKVIYNDASGKVSHAWLWTETLTFRDGVLRRKQRIFRAGREQGYSRKRDGERVGGFTLRQMKKQKTSLCEARAYIYNDALRIAIKSLIQWWLIDIRINMAHPPNDKANYW